MEIKEFLEESERIFAKNPEVDMPSKEKLEQMFGLTEIMLEVNSHMNLTAITDLVGIILKHYVDSLVVSRYIPEGSSVIDVGCGAGFPSLPLAIARPDLTITALDSTEKRIRYVSDTARKLGLQNITAIAGRAEEYANKSEHRESFDIATARAVADLPILAELCLPYVKMGGKFISMKAAKGDEELESARNAIKLCGGANAKLIRTDITADGETYEKRRLIIVDKVEKTPTNYPRNFGRILKKPL